MYLRSQWIPSTQVIQGSQNVPPQSIPSSSPFWIPSTQVIHGSQKVPPQSIPSSSPFWIPSIQVMQGSQNVPPQSIPSSSPFWIPSTHYTSDTRFTERATAIDSFFISVLNAIITVKTRWTETTCHRSQLHLHLHFVYRLYK